MYTEQQMIDLAASVDFTANQLEERGFERIHVASEMIAHGMSALAGIDIEAARHKVADMFVTIRSEIARPKNRAERRRQKANARR